MITIRGVSANAFQRLIQETKAASGDSYRDIADRCRLSKSQIQNLAHGERRHAPTSEVLAELAKGLRVSLRDVERAAAETWLPAADSGPIRTYPRGWDELTPEEQRKIQRDIDWHREQRKRSRP